MSSQRGAILVVVLVGLLAVVMIGGAVSRAIALHHREVHRMELNQQAFWLAESAMQRALHAAANSADYDGETWRVEAREFGGVDDGVAVIRLTTIDESSGARRLVVEAYYPEESADRILYRRELNVYPSSNSGDSS